MNIIKSNTIRAGILVVLVAVGSTGLVDLAHAVVAFNTFPISYTPQQNNDLPMIDARNISKGGTYSTSQADHDNGVLADPNDIVEFQIYYHNTATPEEVARNVIVKANLPGGSRGSHEVSATIDSDETELIQSNSAFRGGNIVVNISGNVSQTLEFISGSVRHFPNRGTSGQTPSNGDSLLGTGLNIGSIQGCFEFSGFVTFRARVGQAIVSERNLSINKRVLNVSKGHTVFLDEAPASPGDRVRFEVRLEMLGNDSQTNIITRDLLPAQLSWAPGSMRMDGANVTESFEQEFRGSGRNLGTITSGASRVMTFEAIVAGSGTFGNIGTTLTNVANVRSDQVQTKQDEARVIVTLPTDTQLALRKTAFNQTQGVDATTLPANPGDVITYTLYYKNTGATQTNNVVIEDNIQDIRELADLINLGGAESVNGLIRYPIVNVPAGVEVSRSFQIRVKQASEFPSISDLVMTNIYGNQVRIPVRKPEVFGAITPPRTGAGEWTAGILAALATTAYVYFERKKSLPKFK